MAIHLLEVNNVVKWLSIHSLLALVIAISLVCIPTQGHSQRSEFFAPPSTPPTLQAKRAQSKITIDGQLTERDWLNAPATTDFFRREPRQGGPYKYHSAAQVLFDDEKIYVGVFARDSSGKKGVRVQDLRRDFTWNENDIIGIQLDPQNLKQYCVSFQTTPYGSQRDLQVFNGETKDNDWNALWEVRTTRTDSGYFAEFAIPFKSLRYDKIAYQDSVSWGITLMRLARREYEQTVFPPIPQSMSPFRMTYAAQLKGIKLPKPGTNIRIEPYALFNYSRDKKNTQVSTDNKFKIGGDIKWAINPRSVVDLTFNTDFAQADVDLAVNNLERFNIFFPERRQFFLENSGIWAGATDKFIVPFFSRRIGLRGNFNATPAPIDIGARFTSRTARQAIAGMYAHQAATEHSAAANFVLGRYLYNYGKENNIGIMVAHRLDEKSEERGTPESNNTTMTLDGLIRPVSQLSIAYLLSGSRDNSNDTLGLAGRLFVGYKGNNFYSGWITRFVTKDYNPDMGFVFQKNVIHHSPGGYYIWRPKNIPWIRRWDPGVYFNYYHDASNTGNFQQGNIYIFPVYVFLTNGSFFEYAITPTWQRINFAFRPLGLGIAEGDYQYTRHKIRFNTDKSAKLSLTGVLDWGKFYNGRRTTITTGLRYAPSVHVAITGDYEWNQLKNIGANQDDLTTHLVSIGTRLALNPRVQLSSFYQYNSFGDEGRWNIRFSWEYQPLSFVYLVFNNREFERFDLPHEQQQFISKLTFIKQF